MERYYLTFGGGGHLRVRNCRRNQTDKKMRHNNDIAACEGNGCPMIERASLWLQENLDDYLDVGVTFLVSDFKKAMQDDTAR